MSGDFLIGLAILFIVITAYRAGYVDGRGWESAKDAAQDEQRGEQG
jgi:hypothetical protein